MLAARSCDWCRFDCDAGFKRVHFFSSLRDTPRLICVNTVDKGDRRRFGVKAVDKGLRGETRKSESRTRNPKSVNRNSDARSYSESVEKGKELAGVAGAERVARGDFTGHDRAG
jgi:hypothetical protein